jgi:two-component system cell cycle sensor histidine kinase/response regulator CckA
VSDPPDVSLPGAADAGAEHNVAQPDGRDSVLRAAQAAIRDTTRLTRLLTILGEPAPLKVLLDRALSTLSELFSADVVALLDPAGSGTYSPLAAIGLPEDVAQRPLAGAIDGPGATAMRTGKPVRTGVEGAEQADAATGLDSQLSELGAEATVWLPVADAHGARGILLLARCHPEPFEDSEVDLLSAMAYRIGLALEQAQRSAQLEQIVSTSREIGRHLEESAVCTEAVRMLPAVVASDGAALVLLDQQGVVHCAAKVGLEAGCESVLVPLAEKLLADSPLLDVQPYTSANLPETPEWPPDLPKPEGPGRALLALPIRREERVNGVLYAVRSSPTPFRRDTVQIGMLYAGQASSALENARLYHVVRDELAERVRTERQLRESERRLSLALDGADLGMWNWDLARGEIHFNQRAAEMLGQGAGATPHDVESWRKLVHPDDLPRVLSAFEEHFAGIGPYQCEYRVVPASGEPIWILAKGNVTHRDAKGRPLRMIGTYLDVTEAKQIQAERLLMEQQRQEVWRAESLSRMAGGIAHHFNNLLLVVMGNLELALQEHPTDGASRTVLDEAMKASRRAAEMGHLMLAYLGQTAGRKDVIDLAAVARDALPLQRGSLPKQVRLETDLPAPEGPLILAEGVHVEQILGNLLSNAIEALGESEGEIRVAVGVVDADDLRGATLLPADWTPAPGSYACLSVSDTGSGLDADLTDRIFEPFFSTKSTGRGLGLPVALGLARAHGGGIALQNRPGGGATFRVVFPLLTAPIAPSLPPRTSLPGEEGGLVLLVDDEPMVLGVGRSQFERLGFEVVTADSGAEAVERFRERSGQVRLAVLDLVMPGMDGWDTLAALRAIDPELRAVLISGYDEAQVMGSERPQQPQVFLQKPYTLGELRQAVATALGSGPRSDRPA